MAKEKRIDINYRMECIFVDIAVLEAEVTEAPNEAPLSFYEAHPYRFDPRRADIISKIMRSICEHESVFTDYVRACGVVDCRCAQCLRALHAVSVFLSRADTLIWEVWRFEGESAEIVGLIYLSDIENGVDAKAHYVFFDRKLTDKTALLQSVQEWAFADHVGWHALKRLTVELPDFAWSVAGHANKYLGFGGDFEYEYKGRSIAVEGVKRAAFRWRGVDRDVWLMGCLNPSATALIADEVNPARED